MTLDEAEKLAQSVIEKYGGGTDKPSVHLSNAAQATCSHAFERIGEARPPFERCVRCYLTRKLESSR